MSAQYFDQTWNHGTNRKWRESDGPKAYYEKIKDKLPDVKFEAFLKKYGSQYVVRPTSQEEEDAAIEKIKNTLLF